MKKQVIFHPTLFAQLAANRKFAKESGGQGRQAEEIPCVKKKEASENPALESAWLHRTKRSGRTASHKEKINIARN